MGFFSSMKAIFQLRKELKRSIAEAKENEKRYLEMTMDELSALSDDELYAKLVDARVAGKEKVLAKNKDIEDKFNK